jgi:hypothetical protein
MTIDPMDSKERLFFQPKQHKSNALATAENSGPALWPVVAIEAEVVTVSVVDTGVACGVTLAGEKLHDTPAGRPEQLNETTESYPFKEVTVMTTVPLCPGVRVSDGGRADIEKSGAAAVPS